MPRSSDALFAALHEYADRPALREHARTMTYTDMLAEVGRRAERLRDENCRRIAIALDNGIDWVLWDLAALRAGRVCVPLPAFFSDAQQRHVLDSAGIDTLVVGDEAASRATGFDPPVAQRARRRVARPPAVPAGTLKVTYTSGTTGRPKGVCLGADALLAVARSVCDATRTGDIRDHLCVLPLATLLENVAGLYAPLLAGATVHLRPVAEVGLVGASGFDAGRFASTLRTARPHSVILVPQLLSALVAIAERDPDAVASLRFVAVGGARVSPSLLRRADALGLPVFEGYGLSECASVVCLNTPGARRIGSVGRPLPHVDVRIDETGDVQVRGPRMLGYLGEPPLAEPWLDTGDLGHFDDGFVVLQGRRKHQFVTAYGRNVNPEWVESELVQQPSIAQAWLHGEALAENVAVIVPRGDAPDAVIDAALAAVNRGLPDYARAHRWLRADEPFTAENGLATANGRSKRTALLERYRDAIERRLGRVPIPAPPRGENRMQFHDMLREQTAAEREYLLSAPIIVRAMRGDVSLESYVAFLGQAYHHVRHTVPLLMACGAHLPDRLAWLRSAVAEYIAEENGHEEWILDDIRECGGDVEAVRASAPNLPTELMVAYVYDRIARINPVSFFGMVEVLEGTSVALATHAAGTIREALGLPPSAFRYLTSHGSLDVEHLEFFKGLIDRLDDAGDRDAVVHTARVVYRLYGDMFRSLPLAGGSGS